MDGMVDLAMTGFKYIPEDDEEELPVKVRRMSRKRKSGGRRGKRSKESVDTAVDMLSSLIDGGSKKAKKSFEESRPGLNRPAKLNIKNEGEEDNLKTPRKKDVPVDIALSPTKSKATDAARSLDTSTTAGKDKDKKNPKMKEYFKSEEIVQLNENVPQLVI